MVDRAGRPGPFGRGRARCARQSVDRGGRPSTPAVDRPVDRLQATHSLFGPVDRQFKTLFLKLPGGRPGGRLEPTTTLPSGLPAKLTPMALLWSVLFFYRFQRLFLFFQVAKLTPNDLVTLMNSIYPLPIIGVMGLLVFHKKNIQVLSFQEKKCFIAFHFQSSFYS